MNVVQLVQGSPEWHAHRATHFNASDAPAMLGCSPYKSRAQLIRERATGIADDVSAETQRLFDRGHRAEALARPLAETIIDEELFPATVTDSRLSASLDGMTMDGSTIFEHKLLSKRLREAFDAIEAECGDGSLLPEDYRIQMEQQLMVSGAERCLFMASEWDHDGNLVAEFHCWYEPDNALRERIVAGWAQFERDLTDYVPEPSAVATAVAAPVEGFGMLSLRVEGRVLASNLDAFRAGAEAFIARLPKPDELQSDQDFADADAAVKACTEAEARIKAAKDAALAQMADVEAVMRTADSVSESIRQARLALDKLVKARKESIKAEIVADGCASVRAHCDAINATLGPHAFQPPQTLQLTIGAAIKGMRSIQAMRDAVDAAAAGMKIEASQQAERVRANVAILAEHAEHRHLFADAVALAASKQPDDLRNLVAARIAEHERQQAAKLEAERERIRREEQERIERQRDAEERGRQMAEAAAKRDAEQKQQAHVAQLAEQAPCKGEAAGSNPAVGSNRMLRLGELNAAIAPLSISADGLSQLGFEPVGQERAAKLYRAADFPRIVDAMVARLVAAANAKIAAAA